ncbi:HAD superfamily phosphatase (TIGR01681 family)/FkbH-like protein [Streptomyces sp. Amel2xB2]|uniref:HAD-IIIC family phosphatase n=1 Tax=Streptomyces sp. Amel2xB2 TaxID=1305829 RepID=UPI000DBA7ABF|nr:HAD-IIIC family phosphatase [Streptomyces sp. Amel2xB2]RAJ68859.1 HAD superfamily phosphatase (TIGR01681 family)/FkbH-like protein [Streptomyces sp. Amel2xB2]
MTAAPEPDAASGPVSDAASGPAPVVKCLVWDLDDTLWDGVVLEGDEPEPFPGALKTLRALDERGILHAAASRGEHAVTARHLDRHGLEEWFCDVRVGWGAKSDAVRRIAEALNIGLDTLAFVDNDPVERAEVASALPMVRCYPAEQAAGLPDLAEFQPEFVTEEAGRRRLLYRTERRRQAAQEEFGADRQGFLASLGLVMTVREATEDDLSRASELTVRTHQLNTSGLTYGAEELRGLTASPGHRVQVAELRDDYGEYGIIGLAVTELTDDDAVLRLMLMSCRVASRGVGTVLLDRLVREAVAERRRPVAHFVPTEANRSMLVTLRFAGFAPVEDGTGAGHADGAGAGGAAGAPLVLAVDPERLAPQRESHVRVVSGTD